MYHFFYSFRTQSRQQYETHLNKHKKWPDRETRRNYKKLSTAVLSKKAWHSWVESRGSLPDPDFKITYNRYDYSAAWPVAFNIKDRFGSRCKGGSEYTHAPCATIFTALYTTTSRNPLWHMDLIWELMHLTGWVRENRDKERIESRSREKVKEWKMSMSFCKHLWLLASYDNTEVSVSR